MTHEVTCLHNLFDYTWIDGIVCMTEMPDGILISGSGRFDGNIKVWNLVENKCLHKLRDFCEEYFWNQIHCLRVMPQSNDLFICGSSDDDIKIWNVRLGRCVKSLRGHTNAVTDLEFDSSNQLISCSKDGTIRIWKFQSFLLSSVKCIRVLNVLCIVYKCIVYVLCIRFNKANGKLLSGSRGAIRIWSLETGECEKTIQTEYSMSHVDLCLSF